MTIVPLHAAADGPRSLAVVDIETVPDPDAMSLAHRLSGDGTRRAALHRVVCASVLRAVEGPGGFSALDLRSFDETAHDEAVIVGFVDLLLPDPADASSTLVTYNGRRADLRILRHRACANWLFAVPALAGWTGSPAGRHVDLLERGFGVGAGDRWSLSDVCAGLGLAIRPGLLGRSVARLHGEGRMDAVVEHNRMDVLGTFLAYGYHRSLETGDDAFAASAWDGVARLMERVPTVNVGAETIARHHLVDVARSRLTACAAAAATR